MQNKNQPIPRLKSISFLMNKYTHAVAPHPFKISKDSILLLNATALSFTSYRIAFDVLTPVFALISNPYAKAKMINIASFNTALFSMIGALSFKLSSLIPVRAMNGAFGTSIFPITTALVFLSKTYGTSAIFYNAIYIILTVGIISTVFVAQFKTWKSQSYYNAPA
ncbi:hypothetical protein [Fusibacter ferrireducens]|uniref:EamA domain-containing protein n=1 Tax=Fusibacter ferrireducens TaxID=2785058 RepID=A0ABR9ZUU2_9FIRM|nr:hypothetical protein [Fusibacter ferrireducens]MBF4694232.1 hypothetical protein [Fusibacter ferrireducens]